MVYHMQPKWASVSVQTIRVLIYVGVVVAGVTTLLIVPELLPMYQISYWLTSVWGVLISAFALCAAYGVSSRKYRFELAALPFILTGLITFNVFSVYISVFYTPTLVTYIAFVATLSLYILMRTVELLAKASRLRREHNELRA